MWQTYCVLSGGKAVHFAHDKCSFSETSRRNTCFPWHINSSNLTRFFFFFFEFVENKYAIIGLFNCARARVEFNTLSVGVKTIGSIKKKKKKIWAQKKSFPLGENGFREIIREGGGEGNNNRSNRLIFQVKSKERRLFPGHYDDNGRLTR